MDIKRIKQIRDFLFLNSVPFVNFDFSVLINKFSREEIEYIAKVFFNIKKTKKSISSLVYTKDPNNSVYLKNNTFEIDICTKEDYELNNKSMDYIGVLSYLEANLKILPVPVFKNYTLASIKEFNTCLKSEDFDLVFSEEDQPEFIYLIILNGKYFPFSLKRNISFYNKDLPDNFKYLNNYILVLAKTSKDVKVIDCLYNGKDLSKSSWEERKKEVLKFNNFYTKANCTGKYNLFFHIDGYPLLRNNLQYYAPKLRQNIFRVNNVKYTDKFISFDLLLDNKIFSEKVKIHKEKCATNLVNNQTVIVTLDYLIFNKDEINIHNIKPYNKILHDNSISFKRLINDRQIR